MKLDWPDDSNHRLHGQGKVVKKKKGRQLLICFQENMLFVHIPPLTIQMRGIRLNESVTVS